MTYKLDSNHNEIVLIAQQLGIKIVDNAMVKRQEPGQLDVWFGITNAETGAGVWVWVEIKTVTGNIRPSQQESINDCQVRGLPQAVVRTVDDVLMLFEKYCK